MSRHNIKTNRTNKTICPYCLGLFKYRQMSDDHILPVSKGGRRENNIVRCCIPCNEEKANMTLLEFALYIQYKQQAQFIELGQLRQLKNNLKKKNKLFYNATVKVIKEKIEGTYHEKEYVFSINNPQERINELYSSSNTSK